MRCKITPLKFSANFSNLLNFCIWKYMEVRVSTVQWERRDEHVFGYRNQWCVGMLYVAQKRQEDLINISVVLWNTSEPTVAKKTQNQAALTALLLMSFLADGTNGLGCTTVRGTGRSFSVDPTVNYRERNGPGWNVKENHIVSAICS